VYGATRYDVAGHKAWAISSAGSPRGYVKTAGASSATGKVALVSWIPTLYQVEMPAKAAKSSSACAVCFPADFAIR